MKENKHHLHIELTEQQYELLKNIGACRKEFIPTWQSL